MTAFLLHYRDFVDDLEVLKFEETKLADIYGFERLSPDRSAKVVAGEEHLKDRDAFSPGLLVAIYNALGPDKPVSKFETRDVAARRTFALLHAKYNGLPTTRVEVAADLPITPPSQEMMTMAKTTTDAPRVRRARAPGVGKQTQGRSAGTVADFKQTREGTARQKILKMMDGTQSPDQIAAVMGGTFTGKYVLAHAYCLRRDCGIGYELTRDGHLLALYPKNRSYADAIKQTGEASASPEQEQEPEQDQVAAEAETETESAAAD